VADDGTVTHRLDGREVDRDDLWHLRAYPTAGSLLGLSPIAYAAETIGLGLAAQQYGAQYFRDSSTPSGYLTGDQLLTQAQADEMIARWEVRHKTRRATAVLGKGLEFRQIMVPPEESQFLETQRLTVQQVCRIYGVPPELVAADAGNSMTYSNLSERTLGLLKFAVDPWLVRLETALTDLVARGQYVKFNRGSLLRADTKSRYEAHAIALQAGFLTIDEVRELEDREPMPAAPARPQIGAVAA
jgi:HK97 family phage portal protein